MKERNVKDLEKLSQANNKTQVIETLNPAGSTSATEELIGMHYPKATSLIDILSDISVWSELNFVMDPSLDREIQIFAPRKLPKDQAFHLFVASLEISGLKALKNDEHNVVKILLRSTSPLKV